MNEFYKAAVKQNDEAHQRTIRQEPQITRERFEEISEEAKMWLRHLDFIYRVTEPEAPPAYNRE